jgi:hypothetical protein
MLRTLFQMLGDNYGQTRLRDVEVIVRSILAAVPGDATALQFLGLVYYRTGRRPDALRAFARAASAPDPGEVFFDRNCFSAAAACQREAQRPSSGLAFAWYDMGVSLAELGYPHRAVCAFRASLVSRPQFPAAGHAIEVLRTHIEQHGVREGEPRQITGLHPVLDAALHPIGALSDGSGATGGPLR